MLIKGTTKKGDAIPLTASEALKHAVVRLCKTLSTLDVVYWLDNRTVKETSFQSMVDKDGKWEAWAEGTADIGKTDAHTNAFHVPVPHTFKVNYKLSKDEWGIPDIEIIGTPEFTPIERDPQKLMGIVPAPPVLQEPTTAHQPEPIRSKIKKQSEAQTK